jgi:hypothetical protein
MSGAMEKRLGQLPCWSSFSMSEIALVSLHTTSELTVSMTARSSVYAIRIALSVLSQSEYACASLFALGHHMPPAVWLRRAMAEFSLSVKRSRSLLHTGVL